MSPGIRITNHVFTAMSLEIAPEDIVSGNQSRHPYVLLRMRFELGLVCLEIPVLSYTLPFPYRGLKPVTST
jgi:hypothetical protein